MWNFVRFGFFLFCVLLFNSFRYDWFDDYCVSIFKVVKVFMGFKLRILICDFVMNIIFGCDEIEVVLSLFLVNYGYYVCYCYNWDIGFMVIINGIERIFFEFKILFEEVGLCLVKFWDIRSMVGIIEVGL